MKKLSLFLIALAMILVSCKPEVEKPTVVTKSVGEVTKTSAKVVGQVAADGGAEVTERGICWSTDGTPTILDFRVKDTEGGLGSYEILFKDLVPNTQYYVRAYATNEAGTGYGDEKTFTTLGDEPEEPGDEPEEPGDEPEEPGDEPEEPGDEPETPEQPEEVAPVVTTSEVTGITVNSAVCGGEVISGGDVVVVVVARGVCWNTSGTPTVSDTYTMDGTNVGIFTSNIPDLVPNTQYYVRAYATNAKGVTGYGEEVTFTTLEKLLPIVTTTADVTEITFSSAKCGGEVTFDGNLATTRGVCWSTSQNPTIEDNKTTDGSGVGSFTSQIPDLVPNTQYYVRAYATNEVGTSYGEEVTFTTLVDPANGREYVDLGLSVKWATCNVGASSPEEYGDYFAWGETTTKAEYTEDNCTTYGVMNDISGNAQYDAATANWGGGWRMPTEDELDELRTKCTWTWTIQNNVNGYKVTGPSGASIFLPAAGYRLGSSLYFAGFDGYYWSSTPDDYYAYGLGFYSSDRWVNYDYRYFGHSVRSVLE